MPSLTHVCFTLTIGMPNRCLWGIMAAFMASFCICSSLIKRELDIVCIPRPLFNSGITSALLFENSCSHNSNGPYHLPGFCCVTISTCWTKGTDPSSVISRYFIKFVLILSWHFATRTLDSTILLVRKHHRILPYFCRFTIASLSSHQPDI